MTSPRVCPALRALSGRPPQRPQAGLDNKLQPATAGASLRAGLGSSQGSGRMPLWEPPVGCLGEGTLWSLRGGGIAVASEGIGGPYTVVSEGIGGADAVVSKMIGGPTLWALRGLRVLTLWSLRGLGVLHCGF